jgi:thiol-disulfide isomerase/thioredoxin
MQFKALAFLSILSILLFTACDSKKDNDNSNTQKADVEVVKPKKVDFTFKTMDNLDLNIKLDADKIVIKDFGEKIVLLNFFATWCPPCKAEIPNLVSLQKKYANDFVVISVVLEQDKSNESIQEFMDKFKINYKVVNSNEIIELAESMGGIKSIPTMFMIDKESNVFQKYVGIVPIEMMEMDIKKLLSK